MSAALIRSEEQRTAAAAGRAVRAKREGGRYETAMRSLPWVESGGEKACCCGLTPAAKSSGAASGLASELRQSSLSRVAPCGEQDIPRVHQHVPCP